jgi:hypothetical protein
MILLLLLSLITIYLFFGVFVLIQILLLTIVFFSSNFLIAINPFSKEFHIIRIMSVIVIIFILYNNSIKLNIANAFILPLSINNISYLDDFINKDSPMLIDSNVKKELFYSSKVGETSKLLNSLDNDSNYIATIEYINDLSIYHLDVYNRNTNSPKMILSNPFLINKFSSSILLTKFMNERLELMIDYYYLDDSVLQDSTIILLTYSKFNYPFSKFIYQLNTSVCLSSFKY